MISSRFIAPAQVIGVASYFVSFAETLPSIAQFARLGGSGDFVLAYSITRTSALQANELYRFPLIKSVVALRSLRISYPVFGLICVSTTSRLALQFTPMHVWFLLGTASNAPAAAPAIDRWHPAWAG
ncbi:hypothetical protein SUGI_1225480 [Cryptomeria japonica]|uniref:Uncharacterized protein n=1 Tax=Cryptomeria japonica TaxID=3369 RepID=A0AAD3NNX9_CRYJA|nr:hypothetical protein SUGI_1225480 [Cryptomeria japonica]